MIVVWRDVGPRPPAHPYDFRFLVRAPGQSVWAVWVPARYRRWPLRLSPATGVATHAPL